LDDQSAFFGNPYIEIEQNIPDFSTSWSEYGGFVPNSDSSGLSQRAASDDENNSGSEFLELFPSNCPSFPSLLIDIAMPEPTLPWLESNEDAVSAHSDGSASAHAVSVDRAVELAPAVSYHLQSPSYAPSSSLRQHMQSNQGSQRSANNVDSSPSSSMSLSSSAADDNIESRPFRCNLPKKDESQCLQSFTCAKNLKDHIARTHLLPVKCPQCGYRFPGMRDRKRHFKTNHLAKSLWTRYPCPVHGCARHDPTNGYPREDHVRRHCKGRHQLTVSNDDVRSHKCPDC
jgi:hypothetical protein